MKPSYSALKIAKYFIKKNNEDGTSNEKKELTNLKLQKMLYYAQGWYLANFHRKLFEDPIEAWRYGPAIRRVYQEFKGFGSQPIDLEISPDEIDDIDKETANFLDTIWGVFKKYSGTDLINSTHQEKPWKTAWEEAQKTKDDGYEIDSSLLESYFGSLKNARQ